jgi:hypothetical protein
VLEDRLAVAVQAEKNELVLKLLNGRAVERGLHVVD